MLIITDTNTTTIQKIRNKYCIYKKKETVLYKKKKINITLKESCNMNTKSHSVYYSYSISSINLWQTITVSIIKVSQNNKHALEYRRKVWETAKKYTHTSTGMKDSTYNGKLLYLCPRCSCNFIWWQFADDNFIIQCKTISEGNRSWESTPCLCPSTKLFKQQGKICTLMRLRCFWWPGSYWFLQNVQRNRLS